MDPRLLNYLSNNWVCTLSVITPDGFPHSSTMHYAHIDEPLTLYFSSDRSSRKCLSLLNGDLVKASVVIGFSDEEGKTLQMDGEVKLLREESVIAKAKETLFTKHPESNEFESDPNTVYLEFSPKWFRYTDYNTDNPTFISG